MNLLAIVGACSKDGSTNFLVDRAIEGAKAKSPDCSVTKINLIERDIRFCTNCLACMKSKTTEPLARCVIRDDMDAISEAILKSDRLIFGTPVHMGFATGVMTTFLERICWTFAKPTRNILMIKGCPAPRSDKKRESVIIITSGCIPPLFRKFCDQATPLIKGTIRDSLNCTTVGDMYAGDLWHRGVDHYTSKAFDLGSKLV